MTRAEIDHLIRILRLHPRLIVWVPTGNALWAQLSRVEISKQSPRYRGMLWNRRRGENVVELDDLPVDELVVTQSGIQMF